MGGVVAKMAFLVGNLRFTSCATSLFHLFDTTVSDSTQPPPPSYQADWDQLIWLNTKRGQRIPALYISYPGYATLGCSALHAGDG